MRSILFGAAMLLATAAVAQPTTNDDQPAEDTAATTQPTEQPAGEPTQTGSTGSTGHTGHSGTMGQTGSTGQTGTTGQMGTTGTTGLSGGGTVAPGNTNPATDARGIPVISAPAVAPAGWNVPPGQGTPAPASGPAPSMGAATDLPPCSRTVTDRCVQTYERGRAR